MDAPESQKMQPRTGADATMYKAVQSPASELEETTPVNKHFAGIGGLVFMNREPAKVAPLHMTDIPYRIQRKITRVNNAPLTARYETNLL